MLIRNMTTALVAALPCRLGAVGDRSVEPTPDPVAVLVGRLDWKDSRPHQGVTDSAIAEEGTDRNRAANDWIEAHSKAGCTNTERVIYVYQPPPHLSPRLRLLLFLQIRARSLPVARCVRESAVLACAA